MAFLNHTSLYEPLFVGGFPDEFIKRIADIVSSITDGRMRLEAVDIAAYRSRLMDRYGPHGFKKALVRDLEARRDRYCSGPESDDDSIYATALG